ncbi:PREDICTED: uncharacterized protein LOC106752267 [Dinoponera quadriceps]|uniref:Odorant receptor n=1 Tax=Dinoponera quadriceps TaxID=609295 RepID=A0A6P3YFU5_DINQU|nr:PREDICTED: uncharacterized protein LOC106752267 [Dinoponera quadriceps]
MIGQWPYCNFTIRFLVRMFVCALLVSFAYVQIAKLSTSKCTFDLIVEVIPPLTICFLWATKYITCWIKDLLRHIKDDLNSIQITEELKIIQNFVEKGRMYGIFLIVLIYSSICMFILIIFWPRIFDIIIPLNESRPLQQPFKTEYFVDQEKYFFPIITHIFVVAFVGLNIGLATDLLFIAFLLHGCAMFTVLEYRLENMFDSLIKPAPNDSDVLSSKVANCVERHKNIVEFVEMINSYYTSSCLVQLVLAVLILTVVLLRLFERLTSIHDADMAELTVCVIHVTGHLFVVFLNIFPAQKLLDCSESIFFKVYCSCWYWVPVKIQKLLLMIMKRSIKPCGITAAGRWRSSLEMFAKVYETDLLRIKNRMTFLLRFVY